MGFNALLRVLNVSFLMVLFSGYVNFDKKVKMVEYGHHFEVKIDSEATALAFCLFIPIFVQSALPFVKKEKLRNEPIELTFNGMYYKSNQASFYSKVYPLTLTL